MKNLIILISILFVLVAAIVLFLSIYYLIKTIFFSNPKSVQADTLLLNNLEKEAFIDKNLRILSSDATPEEKALAVECLIDNKYISVHTLRNKGNNYKDSTQTDTYCNLLTRENLAVLFSLEATDGRYSF